MKILFVINMNKLKNDIQKAVSAIAAGADRFKVYERMVADYPGETTELRRVLLYAPQSGRLEAVEQAIFGRGQRMQ